MSNSIVSKSARYHPISVILHWAVVLLMGVAVMTAGDDGGGNLALHTLIGGIILVLMLIRFVMRWAVKQPAWASTGNDFLDLIGKLTHFGLYFFTFSILVTGAFLFLNGGQGSFFMGAFHSLSWFALFLLIALHIGAAFYHQFLVRDNLLGRMWFRN